jgi:hypothetical protein
MNAILTVIIVVVAFVALFLFGNRRGVQAPSQVAPEATVELRDIPRVYELLVETLSDGRFAVFLFGRNGEPPDPVDALNIQFSIEGGRPGLDWVLLASENVSARERVAEFLENEGAIAEERLMNGVPYLRVEGGDLESLCRRVLVEVFGVADGQQMILIAEGFTW